MMKRSKILKPIISVIIPCFNSSKTIIKTLCSVYDQCNIHESEFEVIIINDGSTDSTNEVLIDFFNKKKIQNLKIVNFSKNKGVSAARNYGIKIAKGKWIIFLDSDDLLNNESLNRIIINGQVNEEKCDLLAFGYITKSDRNKKDYSMYKYSHKFFKNKQFIHLFLSKKIDLHISSMAYKRKFLLKNNIKFDVDKKIAEDLQFIILCLDNIKAVFYDAYHFFIYQTFNSTAMNGYNSFSLDMAKSIGEFKEFTDSFKDSNEIKYFNFYLVNFYAYNLYIIFRSKSYTYSSILLVFNNISVLKRKIVPLNLKRYLCLRLIQLLPVKAYLKYCLWRKSN